MVTAVNAFNRQQKEPFDRENGEKEGIDNIDMRLIRHQRKNLNVIS